MDFSALNKIRQQIPTLLQVLTNEIGDELYKSVEKQFAKSTTPTQLAVRTGQLLKSFKPGDPNNILEVKQSGATVDITYSSKLPYASLHEYGGKINSKGKMHKYFWAMFSKTKDVKYKWMALSVIKNGFIEIPKRPYISKAMEDFKTNKLPTILQRNLNKIF